MFPAAVTAFNVTKLPGHILVTPLVVIVELGRALTVKVVDPCAHSVV